MKKIIGQLLILLIAGIIAKAGVKVVATDDENSSSVREFRYNGPDVGKYDTATFATGCFWCTEAKFQQLKGVVKVVSGYSGGHFKSPTYEQVSTGTTGHAETCNIIFDPAQISFDELLAAFFTAHDPTQLNRQGNDIGTQYRSAIFYHSATQKTKALYYIDKLNKANAYPTKIVTEVAPYTAFYKAEDYHQNFYNQNPQQRYCKFVIQPELEKFRAVFKGKLKQE
jgi:peptide-methionine (S)-S-oxide reductase